MDAPVVALTVTRNLQELLTCFFSRATFLSYKSLLTEQLDYNQYRHSVLWLDLPLKGRWSERKLLLFEEKLVRLIRHNLHNTVTIIPNQSLTNLSLIHI